MGCDIHAVFQKKTPEGCVDVRSMWPQDRSYRLFGWLAEVRGDGPPIVERRGLPDDFSLEHGEDHNGEWMGNHSHSWLLASEILEAPLPEIKPSEQVWGLGKIFHDFLREIRRLQALHGEVRMVFGFDS